MEFNRYQELARRTQDPTIPSETRLNHALLGLGSECGEVLGIYQKAIQGHKIDVNEVVGEMGDVLWFLAELADCLGVSLDYIPQFNVAKLLERYPADEGFSAERSIHRKG